MALPRTLQSDKEFVVANTVKTAPGLFVKENWKVPSASFAGLVSRMSVGIGVISRKLELPGRPLTKTVTNAQPTGKLVTGKEVKEPAFQFVEERFRICPLSRLRN